MELTREPIANSRSFTKHLNTLQSAPLEPVAFEGILGVQGQRRPWLQARVLQNREDHRAKTAEILTMDSNN